MCSLSLALENRSVTRISASPGPLSESSSMTPATCHPATPSGRSISGSKGWTISMNKGAPGVKCSSKTATPARPKRPQPASTSRTGSTRSPTTNAVWRRRSPRARRRRPLRGNSASARVASRRPDANWKRRGESSKGTRRAPDCSSPLSGANLHTRREPRLIRTRGSNCRFGLLRRRRDRQLLPSPDRAHGHRCRTVGHAGRDDEVLNCFARSPPSSPLPSRGDLT